MDAQALLVQWPSMSFLIKLQSRSCVAVWATFIFPWWVEGTASSQEVRLLFLLVRGTEKGPHAARRHSPPPLPCPRQARAPLQPALLLPPPLDAPVSLGSWGLEEQCPALISPLGTQTRETWGAYISMEPLQAVTFPLHVTHTSHITYTISQVYTGHTLHTIYTNILTLVYTHAEKPFTQKQAYYETFTFTQGLTDLHTQLHRQAHIPAHPGTHRTCTHSCARSQCTSTRPWVPMHWPFRNSRSGRGTRGSHQGEDHGF